MELHQRDPILGSGEAVCKRLRDVSLARAWGALEDDLALVVKQRFDLLLGNRIEEAVVVSASFHVELQGLDHQIRGFNFF